MTANDSRSVSELFGDALSQFSKLVRNELQLARAEISMKVGQTTTAIGLLAGAAVFLIPALSAAPDVACHVAGRDWDKVLTSPPSRRPSRIIGGGASGSDWVESAENELACSQEDLGPTSTGYRCSKGACLI